MEEQFDGRDAYIAARDRALLAVVMAENEGKARAAWKLAKAHNRCAFEKVAGRDGDFAPSRLPRIAGELQRG